jgi:deazaflavin-dependent oxidoreductase (nitroreductase family)
MRLSPWLRRALRAPTGLYAIGVGRLFGRRFLLLTHRGRRSGRCYRTMLEVVQWSPRTHEAVAMSGFGPKSNWYLNVLADGAEEVQIGGERFQPQVRRLDTDEAVEVLAGYEWRNRLLAPVVRTILSRLAGFAYDGSEAARRKLVEALPLVAFRRPDDRIA